jgi:ParB-like chromosome segregation protein Spo0J
MRVYKTLPLSAIQIDRLPFKRVLDFVAFLQAGGVTRPIKVMRWSGGYRIRDGRHRYMAHKLLGRTEINCVFGANESQI